jgi:general secretion pathway protein A
MYERFYYLNEKPFKITPDPRFLFWSEGHKEALARLRYGVEERKGFVVITGEVGTGKTTLLQALLARLKDNIHYAIIANPGMRVDDFLYFIGDRFGLLVEPFSKAQFLLKFSDFLHKSARQGKYVLLIVDEAHKLSVELLEEIRLLSNLETAEEKLLNIFLVGQPELNQKLTYPSLLPLRQRICASYHLLPLSREDVGEYLKRRLLVAGAKFSNLFKPGAVRAIYKYTRGYPRAINILADQALLTGFVRGKKEINTGIIREASKDLSLPGERRPRFFPGWLKLGLGAVAGVVAVVLWRIFYFS